MATIKCSSSPKHQIAGLYDLKETLGEGHYAVVKLARHVFTGEKVAVKVIDKTRLDASTQVQMMQEVQLMKLVQHPHVVRLYEVIDTQTKLYLILEYADGGDMYDYIMRHEGGLPEDQARRYFRQIVQAIQYCHKLHVVHRDLKPENVVFFERLGMVKLTDFGFSNQFSPGQRLQTSCGSLAYSAPEILLGDEYDAPAVDIWSLGVILYMLVCGSAPFQEANDSETLTMIMDCKYTFPKHISQACRRLISRMLQREPDLRASLQDIVDDPWLGGAADSEGNAISPQDQLPLVSREHLTEEEHAGILANMVQGKIATKDDIIEALDMNEYNHITATYFLLAERTLREQRQDFAQRLKLRRSSLHRSKARGAEDTTPLLQHEKSDSSGGEEVSGAGAIAKGTKRNVTSGGRPITHRKVVSGSVDHLVDLSSKSFGRHVSSTSSSVVSSSRRHVQEFQDDFKFLSQVTEEDEDEDLEHEETEEAIIGDDGADCVTKLRQLASDDDDDDIIVPRPTARVLSRHSSTSSLIGSPPKAVVSSSIPLDLSIDLSALAAGLRGKFEQQHTTTLHSMHQRTLTTPECDTPAPFPVTSQIGVGSLSRQGSLRRDGSRVEEVSVSQSRRQSNVGRSASPSTTTTPSPQSVTPVGGPTAVSKSAHGSPARYKLKKLVSTHSSPQLVLNQIHEEEVTDQGHSGPVPEARGSPGDVLPDPVESFPTSAAGVAVIRRLEQRRKLHKSRTQSCSSSDASDDDSSKHHHHNPYHHHHSFRRQRDDDSSDNNQDTAASRGGARGYHHPPTTSFADQPKDADCSNNKSNNENNNGTSSTSHRRRHRLSHHQHHPRHHPGGSSASSSSSTSRIRQSHSLNRISELHVVDFSSDDVSSTNNNSTDTSVANGSHPTRHNHQLQLSDANNPPFDMLTRYLESITQQQQLQRDSQNSSDGELDCGSGGGGEIGVSRSRRQHKVNLRVLEQRLNKIQEENNRSADDDEDDDDDDQELIDEDEDECFGANRDDDEEVGDDLSDDDDDDVERRERSESKTRARLSHRVSNNPMDVYNPKHFAQNLNLRSFNPEDYENGNNDPDEISSIKSCDVTTLRKISVRRRIHRAHSCGSLMSLKERRALLATTKNLPILWDFIGAADHEIAIAIDNNNDKSHLTLRLASNPLTVFQLQETTRCCNLC